MTDLPTRASPFDDHGGSDVPSSSEPSFFDSLADPRVGAMSNVQPPTRIGPYHVLGPLGMGGMGEVYKAERRLPIRQVVAVKIIKLGFDSREVIARFESERQALARMDHPNVARVLDAGVTDAGRPYFVMEYVPGRPITDFCDENRLTINDRLRLFDQACEAIAHAHTKAIIHRDIKPANVLAFLHDGKPRVKIIDFGIAKALTADRLTDHTFNTNSGQIVGTYDSMSPEQAEGSPDIDTRTDVYSLGVLLYEMLTGAKPFDRAMFTNTDDQTIRRMLREVEPSRPSTRLNGRSVGDIDAKRSAEQRQIPLNALAEKLRRELEWIPLKAMRKERSRRYVSPLQISEDIKNYLEGKPLLAGPESRVYRARKYVSRHRRSLFVSVALSIILIGGVISYIHAIRAEQRKTIEALVEVRLQKDEVVRQREEARRQEAEAITQASVAEAVSQFQSNMLSSADPQRLLGEKVTVLQATQAALGELDRGRLVDRPLVEAAVRNTIGATLTSLGRYADATPSLRRALELRRGALVRGHRDIAQSLNNLAYVYQAQGQLSSAEPLYREALDIHRAASPSRPRDVAVSLNNLALLCQAQGNLAGAEPLYREALSIRRDVYANASPEVAQSMNNLAFVKQAQGNLAEAESLYRDALLIYRTALPAEHPDIATNLNNLASLLQLRGQLVEAEADYREAIAIYRKALPAGHPDVARALNNLSIALLDDGKLDEAESVAREALSKCRTTIPMVEVDIANSESALGRILAAQGKLIEAEPLLRDAVSIRRQTFGVRAVPTTRSVAALAALLDHTSRTEEARSLRAASGLPYPSTRPEQTP